MKAFFAYPSSELEVKNAIHGAKRKLENLRTDLELHLWEENDYCGRPLTDPIFDGIASADFLIADITELNFNVTFEIGYAIGLSKRVFLTRNNNFTHDKALNDKIGIFDTLGFQSYTEDNSLSHIISTFYPEKSVSLGGVIDNRTPVYILQTPQSNVGMMSIISRIKKARLVYRGYQPADESRLSATKAISDIVSSHGVVVPLLPSSFADSNIHNIRAAFVAGLSFALEKVTLILQPRDGPAPLDVRDLVHTFIDEKDIAEAIGKFALSITERLQAEDPLPVSSGNFLADISIGDPVAENEFQTLGEYYIKTDQFNRASRGEVNLVVGRKGAGKTALFSQLRNEKRSDVDNIVVDLKPEGYQLIRLREDVLEFLAEGARNHLITAFFEYIFYLEICYKILEKDHVRHSRDGRLFEPYQKLQSVYEKASAGGEGDFSERLQTLTKDLVDAFNNRYEKKANQRLNGPEITELVHRHNIRDIRDTLSAYLKYKGSVWVLFDNLDKGWSSHGLRHGDIVILRCLIDAARKIQRQMQAEKHELYCVVFVRNDVYQLLVESSSDYGKESRAVLDWTDSDLLREVIRRRLVQNDIAEDIDFYKVWGLICPSHYNGEETSQYLIDRSLMRPRNLIKLFAHSRGYAVSLGKEKIEASDFEKGLKAYSLDLITEADQEITDILGEDTNLIYYFIGEGEEFDQSKLENIMIDANVDQEKIEAVIEFMLYYGFLGVKNIEGNVVFIFDLNYDMKLFKVLIAKLKKNLTYVLNPAFYPGLNL